MIKSISYSQHEALGWIQELYVKGPFDLDVTYGSGGFYVNGIPRPKITIDLASPLAAVRADVRRLPIKSETISSIIFDPPFLPRSGCKGLKGIMATKYQSAGHSYKAVFDLYNFGMAECNRVLKRYGHLVVKCQDLCNARNQYFTHVEVVYQALLLGLYPKDLFILLSRSRPITWNQKKQNHARKYHSYFWVFGKQNRNINYSLWPEKFLGTAEDSFSGRRQKKPDRCPTMRPNNGKSAAVHKAGHH